MKNLHILLFLVAGLLIFGSSCESVSEATEIAEEFYALKKAKDYEGIIKLLDEDALAENPAEQWLQHFKTVEAEMGGLKSYSKTAFNTSTNNGQTSTSLNYTVEYSKGTLYEKILFVKRNDGFKILGYQSNRDRSKLK